MMSNLKFILALLVSGLLAAVVLFSFGYYKGKAAARIQYDAKVTQLENERLVKVNEIADEYSSVLETENAKKSAILDDYIRLRDAYDGLRSAATTVGVYSDSAAAASEASARGELLAECAKEYVGMAKAADEHAADAVKLYNAWSTVYKVGKGE